MILFWICSRWYFQPSKIMPIKTMILPTIKDTSNHQEWYFQPSMILPTMYGKKFRTDDERKKQMLPIIWVDSVAMSEPDRYGTNALRKKCRVQKNWQKSILLRFLVKEEVWILSCLPFQICHIYICRIPQGRWLKCKRIYLLSSKCTFIWTTSWPQLHFTQNSSRLRGPLHVKFTPAWN